MPFEPLLAGIKDDAIFQLTLDDAANRGRLLMRHLVFAAIKALQGREQTSKTELEREAQAKSIKYLRDWEGPLCRSFPEILRAGFAHALEKDTNAATSAKAPGFASLELMNEAQVHAHVIMARAQQLAEMAAKSNLTVLDGLVCSVMGMGMVRPERNPLRLQVYLEALRTAFRRTQSPAGMQLDWIAQIGSALGWELATIYAQLAENLRRQGVVPATYAIGPGIGRVGGVGRGVGQDLSQYLDPVMPAVHQTDGPSVFQEAASTSSSRTLLTLDKLRRLLAGELGIPIPRSPKEQFAEQFSKEFEADRPPALDAPSQFDPTVPAALEALREMGQVDAIAQRLELRSSSHAFDGGSGKGAVDRMRSDMRRKASSVGDLLGLEVVTLVLDNLVSDTRLLPPIQRLLQRLEKVYLQLALVDSRLFTDHKHPARELFQELTQRSLAYASVISPGFADFLSGVEYAVAPLVAADVENAEPFQAALQRLQDQWHLADQTHEQARLQAVAALQQAEHRNLLATSIAHSITTHPDVSEVPAVSVNFLSGPWAQVVAQARMDGKSLAADKYEELISTLMWSSHPAESVKDTQRLLRVLPRIMSTLREGLDTIRYPSTKTAEFIEAMLGLHQQIFRKKVLQGVGEEAAEDSKLDSVNSPRADDDPWVAPSEANVSNFMDLLEEKPSLVPAEGDLEKTADNCILEDSREKADSASIIEALVVGTWVELLIGDKWHRTQLTWISPRQTLFLFSNALGQTRSMSRRLRDKIVAEDQLRIISSEPVLEDALNAVAELAMRNSVKEIP